ncbi:sensor histidine kinase [Bacillus sp. JCM 19046]|nr:sensor histidine kinase [Bacillus sp. JCM 19045]GAF18099.1 sensor histidine kinase [Bacillus sp. JCM 19046]
MTGSYLFSILSIVFIVLIVNTMLLVFFLLTQQDERSSNSAETFTRGFSQYLSVNDGEPELAQAGVDALEEFGAWFQLLNENGEVITSSLAPSHASSNYTPMDLVHKYKYMDDEFNTYFVGAYEGYSYIVGIPYSDDHRYVFNINTNTVASFLSGSLLTILLVDLVIAGGIGLLFSNKLTKPIHALIERISQLKNRDFHRRDFKKQGIYQSVFSNLNEVSDTLQKHEAEQHKLEQMRNEWISNVSHDLKTPLSSIYGYGELLKAGDVSEKERLEYAEVIERQSTYIRNLIDDFNLTMRLRSQQVPLQLENTRMETFVREIVIDVLNEPAFKDATITFTSHAHDVTKQIDQHLFKRALLNFLYNALIHNDQDVSVTVTVTPKFILIEDDGEGIQGDVDLVFDRYYRGSNTSAVNGTGLGMAIARDIIEAHGALLELSSTQESGTAIKIIFPM